MTHGESSTSDRRLLMERSVSGRSAASLPVSDVPNSELPASALLREELELPEISQLEMIRYFTLLSQLNFSIDSNFYPLGSCTMKYNPKINDELASLSGFTEAHPLQATESIQGSLQLIYELQQMLGEIVGLPGVCLSPLAGAQGEYAGLLIARAFHASRSEKSRTIALIPDSAHGTNPASAAMAGLEVVTVQSDDHGDIDLASLRKLVDERTAVFMLTIPSTLGLFDRNILEINRIVRNAGGLVYADGANLNALLGLARLGDMGFDICHSNLHKTFSTPHGGGGPGAGPVMVSEELKDFLPDPIVVKNGGDYCLHSPPHTVGRLNGYHGSFSILVRAYAYIRSLGASGIRSVAEHAIINANYVQAKLKDIYDPADDRFCMHETVLSARRQKQRGASGLDIAKRLLDYGIHAPTMYFPTIVDEALMVEPTETESLETLDRFVTVMRAIDREVDENPQLLQEAPHLLPNTRLDEATAARRPYLRWIRQDDLGSTYKRSLNPNPYD